jgi:uncharacterized protein YdeI (YjbR/CyaY-like superfamily)
VANPLNAVPPRNPRVDRYIEQSADFARPVLVHLREVVHETCPDVEEAIKWGFPNFVYRGMLCHMAAFKNHCAFGFWKGTAVVENAGERAEEAMGHFGRITSLSELPPDEVLAGYIRLAMELNEQGVKAAEKKPVKAEIPMPDDFRRELDEHPAAGATFEGFSPSARREYLEWITEAKTAATRERRMATALEWLAEGKPRNWKYMKG